MISDETIDRVREAADIVQIIGEHVSLKRTGADFRGPCPFHQGTHRNFSVSPKKGIYYCFVCHEGGDVFTFLQKRLGMDWPSAVRYVAERVGIEVREVDVRREERDERQPFWDVNAAAADFFRSMLWEDDEGRAARDYLALRRVSREVADRFGLGYAPRDPVALRDRLGALGYADELLLEAGLLVKRENSEEIRPRFRGRLIFPILDAAGRSVGFGGRLLGPGEPKYLNSAESRIFSKARLLYGLNWAKHAIRRHDLVLIVEGYFDLVRVASSGIQHVVAPLGTALTETQAGLLARYTRRAVLLYDSDKPGLKATFRAGDLLLAHRFSVEVVTLPEGEDPDSFVDKHGPDALAHELANTVDILERKLQLAQRRGWFATLRMKRRAIDKLLSTIRATADPVLQDLYIARASEASGVTRSTLERELGEALRTAHPRVLAVAAPELPGRRPTPPEPQAHPERRYRSTSAERMLVSAMLLDRGTIDRIAEAFGPEDFRDPLYREVYTTLMRLGPAASVDEVANEITPAAAVALEDAVARRESIQDFERTIADSIKKLRSLVIEERLEEIPRELSIASQEAAEDLERERVLLVKERQALRWGTYKAFW